MGLTKLIQDILLALKQSRKDISLLRNNIITDLEHMKIAPDKTQQMRLVNTQRAELRAPTQIRRYWKWLES